MWWLMGCAPAFLWEPDCADFSDMIVTDPEGLADEADLADAEEALAAFASWVGVRGVCVDEVRFVSDAMSTHPEVIGQYRAGAELVVVEPESSTGVSAIVAHELCHAWDARQDFSGLHPDLVPPGWPLDEELYPTDELRTAEYFAQSCQNGPRPHALFDAADEVCGGADPWGRILQDEVFPAYTESVDIGIGGEIASAVLDVEGLPGDPGDLWIGQVQAAGDGLAVLYATESRYHLGSLDLDTLSWDDVFVPEVNSATLLPTTAAAAPILSVWDADHEISLLTLEDGALVPLDAPWLVTLGRAHTTLAIEPEGVYWQLWNDGLPLQRTPFASGDTMAVAGSEDLAIAPGVVRLFEGQLARENLWYEPWRRPWTISDGGIRLLEAPPGVFPVAQSQDGTLLATGDISIDGVRREALLTRDRAGAWALSPTSCEAQERAHTFVNADGRFFSWSREEAGVVLEEFSVGE